MTSSPKPTVDAVVLTMNDRPAEFPRAMASLLAQEGVDLRVVIVGNGCEPDYVPDGVTVVALPENLGIPEGRNVGADALAGVDAGEFIFFFDNDAILPGTDVLARLVEQARRHPEAAYIQPRIADPDTGVTVRRWVPRLRAGDPSRPGTVTAMAEGVVLIRRADFERAGRWPGAFFLYHEGFDLALRIWDLGRTGYYAPDIIVQHPASDPARHALYLRLVARNRVWVAFRRLPAPLVPIYITSWIVITSLRMRRDRAALGTWFKGLREGLRGGHGERRPISWTTVWRLARAGRPPIL
ncbi:glycosyltransferase family 2 protein [Streptomyces kaniharaensis]|uniref:Glycosyltransferase family 2 protein n=1 Tax=Streptomyces kaniharaensis TaxID=212423 RepID=A0A6N7KX06_9ACTN|nr:glycosyltransferase [Streptomyces kaniharaensis]MQS16001.1 glycosyltransferase family 2 protein [Streptomyces kaniharaensis]